MRPKAIWPGPVLAALLFLGAMFWAKERDPFHRLWFKVQALGCGKVECVAVLPKTRLEPREQSPESGGRLPVVLYLHGSGGSLLQSGNELRQMAEMGLAAVGLEYSQTNEAACDAEIEALLDWSQRQPWADTNRIAWVGYSLGAQRLLAFALRRPQRQPQLLIRLAGGWVSELDSAIPSFPGPDPKSAPRGHCSAFLLQGEHDEVFPFSEAERVAACLQSNGMPVELRVLPGLNHGLEGNRLLVFRAIGEYCLTHLDGPEALGCYQSILSWQARAWPLWVYWLPAFGWGLGWMYWKRRGGAGPIRAVAEGERSAITAQVAGRSVPVRSEDSSGPNDVDFVAHGGDPGRSARLGWWEMALRWVAATLALAALAVTALHLVPPRLAVSERTLDLARRHLIQPKEASDFEFLAANPVWRAKPLKVLLEHVELANYTRELVNWKLDDPIYRDYVLSPFIAPAVDGELNWRRPLWESFYPRIRKEETTEAAAGIVVRFLRERVTVSGSGSFPVAVEQVWQQQLASLRGFEAVYVAAMRAAGIPARLDKEGHAEFWTGSVWRPAPRPAVESWSGRIPVFQGVP